MNTMRLLVLATLAIASMLGPMAMAQEIGQCSVSDSDYICTKDECYKKPVFDACNAASGVGVGGVMEACCAGSCGTCGSCSEAAPLQLLTQTFRDWKIGGWLQTGYHTEGANGAGTGLFNNYPNVVQLQQAWLYLEKEANTCGYGWDWGFRLDYVYGTDGQDTQAFGNRPGHWDEGWDAGNFYGHAMPQLYSVLAYDNIKLKIGHFYTILGYEVVPAPNNFFYSHSYSMTLTEPYTHTGALAEWAVGDSLTLYGGWTQGWDTGYSNNQGSTFLGGISLQLTDAMSLMYATTMGDYGFGPGGSDSDAYSHSIVLDWNIADRLNYVFQTNYGDNGLLFGALGAPGATNGKVFSINQYLLYTVNDCWAFGTRGEWFKAGGIAEISAFTFGANYRPRANVLVRPEVRVDAFDPVLGLQDSTVFGIDAIFTY